MATRLYVMATVFGLILSMATQAQAASRNFFAFLNGYHEVPSVFTNASGLFRGHINDDGSIDFSLEIENLSSPIAAAHIHFAQKDVNGNVVVTLCGDPPIAVADACANTIMGTITAENVNDAALAQGIEAGNFGALLEIIRSGNAYVNVHTPNFPGGEIRGQIR